MKASRSDYSIEYLAGLSEWKKLKPDYIKLYQNASAPSPFQSPEWINAWMKTSGKLFEPLFINIRGQGKRLELSWIFFRYPAIGGVGFWPVSCDTADILAPLELDQQPERDRALVHALGSLLETAMYFWVPILSGEYWNKRLKPHFNGLSRQPRILTRARSTNLRLRLPDGDFPSYLETRMGSKSKKMLRNAESRLEREGTISVIYQRGCEGLEDGLKKWEALEKSSWQSSEGFSRLTQPQMKPFYDEAVPLLASSSRLRLAFLMSGSRVAAGELGLVQGSTLFMHHICYDPAFAKASPGRVLLMKCLADAHGQGIREYDFLQGSHDYKMELANVHDPLLDVLLTQRGWKGWFNHALVRLFSRGKKG